MKALLEGKPLGHPLHPILVHYPIGLFVLGVVFDVAGLIARENWLVRGALYALIGGVGTALLAAAVGFVDWSDIRVDHPEKRTATIHMVVNLIAVGIFAISVGLRIGTRDGAETPVVPFVLSLMALGLVSYSGYLGGTLVYADGIAVGRHRRRTATPTRTVAVPDGRLALVPIPGAQTLGEGESVRVEIGGHVLAVAKVDGEFAAFQEFCTHRYGPLSEGRLCDGQVECPWHRSRFDVRTGRVTSGPAKEDIAVYPVVVRDGVLHVRVRNEERTIDHTVAPASRVPDEPVTNRDDLVPQAAPEFTETNEHVK